MDKLFNITMVVSVSVYGACEADAIAGVKKAINEGLSESYDTEVDGFYNATAEEAAEVQQ